MEHFAFLRSERWPCGGGGVGGGLGLILDHLDSIKSFPFFLRWGGGGLRPTATENFVACSEYIFVYSFERNVENRFKIFVEGLFRPYFRKGTGHSFEKVQHMFL